jgi:hypothetical protein
VQLDTQKFPFRELLRQRVLMGVAGKQQFNPENINLLLTDRQQFKIHIEKHAKQVGCKCDIFGSVCV